MEEARLVPLPRTGDGEDQRNKSGDIVSVSRNHRFLNQLPIPDYYRHVFVALRRQDPGSSPSSIDGVELFLENEVARVVRNNIINILRREFDEEDWLKLCNSNYRIENSRVQEPGTLRRFNYLIGQILGEKVMYNLYERNCSVLAQLLLSPKV